MTLLGAQDFYSELDGTRLVSIAGALGSGKTAMSFELSEYYLKRGMKLYTNIRSIWADNLEAPDASIKDSVLILDEGGRYLREWKQFEDIFEFSRKLNNYILIPSRRVSHENLAELLVKPIFPFKPFFGTNGGVWQWSLSDGTQNVKGTFVYFPTCYGVYDTLDFSRSPKYIIEAFQHEIDTIQRTEYGRDGIQSLAGSSGHGDAEADFIHRQKLEAIALSLSNSYRKSRK